MENTIFSQAQGEMLYLLAESPVQFIETNSLNVRSAIYTFASNESTALVTLFPMVHLGSRDFYNDVRCRISNCSAAIVEGVESGAASVLTLSYTLFGFYRSMGLIKQSEADLFAEFDGEFVHGDVSGDQFDIAWSGLPLRLRIAVCLVAPYVGLTRVFSRSTRQLAARLETNDLPSRREVLRSPDSEAYNEVVGNLRDQHLLGILTDYLQSEASTDGHLAVVFGARHMPAVAGFLLNKTSYRVRSSEWLTVFEHGTA